VSPSPVRWGGLHNARDLGGLPAGSSVTRRSALFRSPQLDDVDAAGWRALAGSGVTTIVDLRNEREVAPLPLLPPHISTVRAPVEDESASDFMAEWGGRLGTPDYYGEILRRWPHLVSAAVGAVADAGPGGVLVHCAAGRDRTGMVVAVVLRAVGVSIGDVVDDYEVGVRHTNAYLSVTPDIESALHGEELEAAIAAKRSSLTDFLSALDARGYLLGAGTTRDQLRRLRERLLTVRSS
jgi:protein-tyrosine phosphatase